MSKYELYLEEFLPYQLSYLTNLVSQDLASLYTERFGIAHTEWRVMAVLGVESRVSAAYVAEKTAMDKVAVSRAINGMIKRGLIDRKFANDDKRRSELALSEAGRKKYQKIVPLVQEYEKNLLKQLDEKEKQALNAILSKLTEFIRQK